MKTILATFAALLTFSVGVAGTLKVKKVKTAGYDRIMISGDFTVILVAGKEGEITVEGDRVDVNHLVVRSDGDVLRIYPEKDFRDWTKDMKSITLTIPVESIAQLVYAGTGKIDSQVTVKADVFKAQITGSAQVSLDLETNETEIFLSGAGKFRLSGNTRKFISRIDGDGRVEAYALRSVLAEATIIGSGKSEIGNSEALNAQVAGSGRISYIGEPKLEKSIVGSGLIAARQ